MRIHIIGIAGNTTAPLAKLLKKDLGYEVTGSDQEKIYDPLKSYLLNLGIKFTFGYDSKNITRDLDLVIVGASALIVDPHNPEVSKAKELGLKIISHSQALREFFIKPQCVCLAGSQGKTTITALVAWIFETAKKKPSFFIGGKALNFTDYLEKRDSSWTIVEADEYRHPWFDFDDQPRFLKYQPDHALINAVYWEHRDVYASKEVYLKAFADFINLVPAKGVLLINAKDRDLGKLVQKARARVVTYSVEAKIKADWQLGDYRFGERETFLEIRGPGEFFSLKTQLFGFYNLENILASVALSAELGIGKQAIIKALETFKGVEKRLELMAHNQGIWFYNDFAQSAPRIEASLKALKEKFPQQKILVVFDPHAGFLQKKSGLLGFDQAFSLADQILVSKIFFRPGIEKQERTTGREIITRIGLNKAVYLPLAEEMIKKVYSFTKTHKVVVFMSSGGLRGEKIRKQIVAKFKKEA